MSLLPRALLVNDPLSPLGKLVVREEVKVDPILEFNKGDHCGLWVTEYDYEMIQEEDCRQHKSNGTAQQPVPQVLPPSSPEAQGAVAVPPMFKVGDRVRAINRFTPWYAVGDVGVVLVVSSTLMVSFEPSPTTNKSLREIGTCCRLQDFELVPSKPTEDSEGWTPAISMLCPDAKAGEWEAKRFDGSIVSADRIRMGLREWAERLAARGLDGSFRLVKQS